MTTRTFISTIEVPIEGIFDDTQNYSGATYGSARAAYVGGTKTFLFRSLVNFDVSAIAAYSINSASLWLYHYVVTNTPTAHISRNTRPSTWVEGEVTWLEFSSGNAWTAGGGDVDDTTPTEVTFSLAGSIGWQEITGLKDHVDDAIASRGNIVALNLHLADQDPGFDDGHYWRGRRYGSLIWYLKVDYEGPAAGRRRTPTQVF